MSNVKRHLALHNPRTGEENDPSCLLSPDNIRSHFGKLFDLHFTPMITKILEKRSKPTQPPLPVPMGIPGQYLSEQSRALVRLKTQVRW